MKGKYQEPLLRDCGNYLDMNLSMAKYLAKKFLDNVLTNIGESNLNYPK